MLFEAPTSTYSELGTVSGNVFSSLLPYLYVICGIVMTFYIIETIKFWFSDYPERYEKLEKEKLQKEETRKKDFRAVLEEKDHFKGMDKARQYESKYDKIK